MNTQTLLKSTPAQLGENDLTVFWYRVACCRRNPSASTLADVGIQPRTQCNS